MIHNDVQNQLALLVKTSATPLIEVARTPVETPEWVPGQRLPAHVVASLPNGRFHVLVEDQTLDMNLPRSTQPGDTLDLVFVSGSPRPTFALMADLSKALPSAAQQVDLSPTGKFLGNLVQQQNSTGGPVILSPRMPLLPGAPTSVQQFVAALKDAISNSGLFYESHQAKWVTGERSLASLLQEPQGRLSNLQQGMLQPGTAENKTIINERVFTSSAGQGAALTQDAAKNPTIVLEKSLGLAPLPLASSTTTSASDPVHPSTSTIVQQQLNMVDSRQVIWQGQIWPGQEMKWEIEEDESGRRETEGNESAWHTRLNINFPVLGGVTANLSLASSGLKLNFSVAEESTASVMKTETPSLLQSLESSGLNVTSMLVEHRHG